jgi:hypothetical protein
MKNINVLYMNQQLKQLEAFSAACGKFYTVFTASSLSEAQLISSANEIHILIVEPGPGEDKNALEAFCALYPKQIRFMFASDAEKGAVPFGEQQNHFKSILKTMPPESLTKIIDKAYEIYTLEKMKEELKTQRQQIEEELFALQ